MKPFILILSCLFAVNCACLAQNTVVDTHPTASIFAIDYSTGQEVPATYDAAILFKNSLIDLVTNTTTAKLQLTKVVPGKKSFVITQMNPQTSGNTYQLALQSRFLSQTITIYTFVYNVDQNALSYYNPQVQGYVPVPIEGYNLNNLNNCYAFGKFNVPQPQMAAAPAQAVDAADATPIDADVTATMVPPALPDYEQPECPVEGYLWQPGYWAYGRDVSGYYWVPGAWVAPPSIGMLWTPPYWGFDGGVYVFHGGYWGNTIGFYGGLNYGFGYSGVGFYGGDWHEGHFRYNTAVLRVNERVIHNVYVDRTVIVVGERNRSSFNGRGGIMARPNEREMLAMKEHHVMATPEQIRNQRAARSDKSQFASANGGRPATVASERALDSRRGANGGERPGTNGGERPGTNGVQGQRPGMNAAPGANPASDPQGRQRPGMNAAPGANPNEAGAQGQRPNMNAASGANPNTPGAQQGQRPGMNAAPGATPNVPGAQGQRPGTNAASGANPAVPGGQPGQRPGTPGTRQGVNKTAPKTPPAHTRTEDKTPPPAKSDKP
jgi:hypothetical protein